MVDAVNGSPAVRPTVLIADDDEMLQEALQEMLQDEGYRIVGVTGNGVEAVELGKELKPDLALIDYRMPGADGVFVTESIKEHSPETQILMFTAYNETSLSIDATRVGIFAFLVKGCAPSVLLQALESALEHKRELAEVPGPGIAHGTTTPSSNL
jgi:response regulator NasT